ncbi:MAG: ROK family protein [Chloroflexi bacterium]|nr:ROK family protein [Chloroflexota bacterium]
MTEPPQHVLALDFGGTKLAAGVVNLKQSTLVHALRTDTPAEGGAESTFSAMTALARRLEQTEPIVGIGVSFGGHVLDGRILRSMHVAGWEDFPLAERLGSAFGVDVIRIANDANAVALGEWRFGAGKGCESLLYVTVSTGIGGGLVLNGDLFPGAHGMAGEIGHMQIVSNGPVCTCGRRGCLEALAAGPAIARRALELLTHPEYRSSSLCECEHLTSVDVASAADAGDPLAIAVLKEAAAHLGIGIANAINLLDVACVVVGGGVSRAGSHWWSTVQATVTAASLGKGEGVRLARSMLGINEGIWGGAALFS